MSVDPFQRFLGVDRSSDPLTLLGLTRDRCDAASVEAALRQRLSKVYQHPGGRSMDAERVRRRLREAADTVLESIRRSGGVAAGIGSGHAGPAAPPARGQVRLRPAGDLPSPRQSSVSAAMIRSIAVARLTDFDRHVLAVLVGCGGWNATSRSKLVALAGAYGVTVQGLIKVVTRLSEYAKSGGPRLGVAEITSGAARVAGLPPVPVVRGEAEPPWLVRLTPELRHAGAWATVKLSLLFGSLTLLVGVVAARLLFFPAEAGPAAGRGEPAQVTPMESGRIAQPTQPPAPTELGPAVPQALRLAKFPHPPTFLGQALSTEATRAADECAQLPDEIETVARRIAVSDEPSEAVYRSWDAFMRTAGSGWALLDDNTREAIDRAIFEALYEASDSPSVADRLLAALTPPSGRLAEPIDVWRGAWTAGMLGKISRSASLSPALVERARTQLDIALGDSAPQQTAEFVTAASAWLDRTVAPLVEVMELDGRIYDFWECWIAAQRRLGRGERLNAAVMRAIEAILATSTDLSRPGPSVNVLGRLLSMADFESSVVVKGHLREFFEDQQRIGVHDLWVLTSLLARRDLAPWFSEDLVLPDDADWLFRRRIADRIGQRWPEAASAERESLAEATGIPIDPALGSRWVMLLQRELDRPLSAGAAHLMDQLVTACRLNEAASRLAARDEAPARDLLDRIEAAAAPEPDDGSSATPGRSVSPRGARALSPGAASPGRAIGRDGEWAAAYEQAGRNTEEKLESLRSLRRTAGADLGPIDAEMFVRVVYRGSPQDVRALAQSIAVEQFAAGPNVAMEMLDQFRGLSANQRTAETIRRFTSRLLPTARSESWAIDARLALVEHALELRQAGLGELDRRTSAVVESYLNRQAALQPRRSSPTTAATPHEAAQGLMEMWRDRAAMAVVADPVPGDLADLARRHATRLRLAEGPLHRFVAAQLGLLDLMTYLAVAEQPALREPILAMLAESARRRGRMTHVLEQAVELERTIGKLWRMQLAVHAVGDGNE